MKVPLAAYIDLLAPSISTDLVCETSLNRIRTISQNLPVLSFGCFECWLDANSPRVDFNIAIAGQLNEHKALTEWFSHHPEPASQPQRTAFLKAQAICKTWYGERFILYPHIKLLWLVFDIPDPGLTPSPAPWMYLHFRRNRFNDDREVRTEIILQTLALLDDHHEDTRHSRFRPFFGSVSPAVDICSVGKPTTRNTDGLRVYLMMATFSDLLGVLATHGWPGDLTDLRQQLAPLLADCDFLGLSIDINPTIQAKIGIECWYDGGQAAKKIAQLTSLLVQKGLCTAPKRAALLRWNGESSFTTDSHFWSWPDQPPPPLPGVPTGVVVRRMAHYVKLIYEPGKALTAKGYLFFNRLVQGT